MEMVGDNKEIDLLCTDKSISRISVNLSRSSCGKCSITEEEKGEEEDLRSSGRKLETSKFIYNSRLFSIHSLSR